LTIFTRDRTETTTRRLHASTVDAIVSEHRRHLAVVAPVVDFEVGERKAHHALSIAPAALAYSPVDGRYLGSAVLLGMEAREPLDLTRFILVDDTCDVTAEQLQAVRVDEAGHVVNGHLRKPAPERAKAADAPSDDEGEPLGDDVLTRVLSDHRARTARMFASSPNSPVSLPSIELAWSANGVFAGSTTDAEVAEHRRQLIVLRDSDTPTLTDLRRVRRHRDGRVTWAPSV
jgi:hypothetical protein